MPQHDLLAEVTVRVTDARGCAVSEPARDLVQTGRRFLMQACLERAANLLRGAFWRRCPDGHDLNRSLRLHFWGQPWTGAVNKARDRKLELIPSAQECVDPRRLIVLDDGRHFASLFELFVVVVHHWLSPVRVRLLVPLLLAGAMRSRLNRLAKRDTLDVTRRS